MSIHFIGQKMLISYKNVSNSLMDLNISMFLLDSFIRLKISFHLRVKYNIRINFYYFLSLQT